MMNKTERAAFIEITSLVNDMTKTMTKVTGILRDQVVDVEKRLGRVKDLLEQPEKGGE
jgi:hypothetical protein